MKQEKLMNAINDLDDALIENAAPRAKRSARVLWMRVGTVAACFAVVFGVWIGIRNTNVPDEPDGVQNDVHNDVDLPPAADIVHPIVPPSPEPSQGGEVTVDTAERTIYYLDNGVIVSVTEDILCTSEELFSCWCELNGIGEDVRLVDLQLTSNGRESIVNVNGEDMTISEPGDKRILRLNVSAELNAYLTDGEGGLLLEALKQTMLAYTQADEYHLVIE